MRTLTLTVPRNSMLFSRIVRVACDSDSATNACARPPSDETVCAVFAALPQALLLSCGHAAHSAASQWPSVPACLHNLCRRRDAPAEDFPPLAAPPLYYPMLPPEVSRHAHEHRWRLSTTGFHSRLRASCACSLFFPLSVGFGPTASCANGAFTIAPSMLCQAQAMPSISSYSANPFRHSFTKRPWRFHNWKYLCMELALPNRSFGNAFHWQPVRSTYTIPSKTRLASSGLRPPPGFRNYLRPFSRLRFGIKGSTFSHNSSETVQDLVAFMPQNSAKNPKTCQHFICG